MAILQHLPTTADAGPEAASIRIDADQVVIERLAVTDRALADLLSSRPPAERAALVERVLVVGARSLLTAGVGVDIDAVDARVRRITEEAERRVVRLLEEGERVFSESFDPHQRSSLMGRALDDFGRWRDAVLSELDPERSDSHTAVFLSRLAEVLGRGGALERRLEEILDPDADGSALGTLAATIETRLAELRDLVVREQGRHEGASVEAERGTAHGYAFEDRVEGWLRAEAAAMGGCVVERTADLTGTLPNAKVGDFVVTLPDGARIVVEAKNHGTLSLTGRAGVLPELDRAMANREAVAAICVSGKEAFPIEVGRFGVYGDRILVVDDGDGTMLTVALRWAAAARTGAGGGGGIDAAGALDRVERIRTLAKRISTAQTRLTGVHEGVAAVKELLSELRSDLLELTDDLRRRVTGGEPKAR